MLACRNCRINLAAASGCAICNPVRKHLIVVGEDEDDRPSLSLTGNEIVKLLNNQLKDVKKRLISDPSDLDSEKRLITIANSAAKILESARKIQTDGLSAIENMSFAERAELFIDWLSMLTPAYRAALREKWDEYENETSRPLSQLEAKALPMGTL